MSISIDLDSAATVADLSTALQDFGTQADGDLGELETSYSGMVNDSGSNCDILGAVGGMVRKATAPFVSAMKASIAAVEGAVKTAINAVGAIIKGAKDAVGAAIAKINELITFLGSALEDVLADAKAAAQAVIDSVNAAIGAALGVVQTVVDTMTEIAGEMLAEVRTLAIRSCEGVTEAINNVGTGAGIDSTYNAVSKQTDGDFAEQNTTPMKNLLDSKATILNSNNDSISNVDQSVADINGSFSGIDDLIGA